LSELWSRIRFFVTGKKRADVDEELRFHMEREIEANIAAGMPATEAKRHAMIAFGSRERAREECREERPSFFLESLGRDLRFGLRLPKKSIVAVSCQTTPRSSSLLFSEAPRAADDDDVHLVGSAKRVAGVQSTELVAAEPVKIL